jgi:hypothetical protein
MNANGRLEAVGKREAQVDRGPVEDAFWAFIDKKWKDSLNVAAAEPAGWDQGGGYSRGVGTIKKEEQDKQGVKRAPAAGVHVALAGSSQVTPGRTQKRCKFADVAAGCTGSHPPWLDVTNII